MKTTHLFLLVLMVSLLACNRQQQAKQPKENEITLRIKVDSIEFESLSLLVNTSGSMRFKAERSGNEWKISIPDSIPYASSYERILGSKNGKNYKIMFKINYNNTNRRFNTFLLSDTSDQYIHLVVDSTVSYRGHPVYENSFVSFCYMTPDTDSDIFHSVGFQLDAFEWRDTEKHIDLVSQYTDSYTLLRAFQDMYRDYKASEQEKIFNYFSPRIQNTRLGRDIKAEIERALRFTHFDNIELIDWQTNKPVRILQDTTKYNLVIFSTSWCGPCRAEIPALKKIHADLKQNLDMVYISADKKNGIEAWRKLMRDEQIPWRSVLAYPQRVEVNKKYFVEGYPTSYLIHPNGQFEKIDIRIAEQKARLYELVQKK